MKSLCVLFQAVAGGPRATDRFAAVTAAFVSGLAGTTRAVEVVAFFLESAASRLEEAVKVRRSFTAQQCFIRIPCFPPVMPRQLAGK